MTSDRVKQYEELYQVDLLDEYSYKDFTNQSFTHLPASTFNNKIIAGSCFYQEGALEVNVFPAGVTGLQFVDRCNLDNVAVPANCTADATCTNKSIQLQNDLEDWVLDSNGDPLEPVHKKLFLKYSLSTDPGDLPETPLSKSVLITAMENE